VLSVCWRDSRWVLLQFSRRKNWIWSRWQSLRNVLIVSEIAITLVLAFASGLLLRSLNAAETAYPGFRPEHLLSLELVLPSSGYKTAEAQQNFYDRLIADLRGLRGVTEVGAVHCPPSAGDCGDWFYSVLDRPAPARSEVPVALVNIADPSYFRTMGIALRQGRTFTEADRGKAQPVAIVNETFARKWWPKESAVGRRIKSGGPYFDGPVYEIVGVAGDVSQMGLDSEPLPEIYLPFSQAPSPAMVAMIRTTGDPELLAPSVRQRIMSMDRNLPVESVGAFDKRLGATLQRRRFSTLLPYFVRRAGDDPGGRRHLWPSELLGKCSRGRDCDSRRARRFPSGDPPLGHWSRSETGNARHHAGRRRGFSYVALDGKPGLRCIRARSCDAGSGCVRRFRHHRSCRAASCMACDTNRYGAKTSSRLDLDSRSRLIVQ
jgi:MacB-like periplasmic core domain